MQVLLTGGASFLGLSIIPQLVKKGAHVTVTWLNRKPPIDRLFCPHDAVSMARINLSDREAYSVLPRKIDAIIHLAAASSPLYYSNEDMVNNNINGTLNLIHYAIDTGAKYFIFASSISVHGTINSPLVTESTPIINPDSYGISKYLCEMLLMDYRQYFSSMAIRFPAILGSGAKRHWLANILDQACKGEDIIIYNPHSLFNNAIHCYDVANFILCNLRSEWLDCHVFPLGADGAITIMELVKKMIIVSGSSSRIIIEETPKTSFTISSEYAKNNFNYKPRDIKETLSLYFKESFARPLSEVNKFCVI